MLRIISFLCFFTVSLIGVNSGIASDLKIGIVDMQKIVEKSDPGEKAMEQLKDELNDMQSKLETKKSELDELNEALEKQSVMLSEEAQSDKEQEFKTKIQEFQQLRQSYQEKAQAKEQELSGPIVQKLAEVIDSYGEENDYSFIIDKRNSGLVYGEDSLEITEEIMDEFNKAWSQEQKGE
ncbi:MAG: OmpH family outer membrane protein [Thermodesulfobacteriota bacterium]